MAGVLAFGRWVATLIGPLEEEENIRGEDYDCNCKEAITTRNRTLGNVYQPSLNHTTL